MTIDYAAFYTIDLATGQLTSIPVNPPGELPNPLVFSTTDGKYAMGSFVKSAPPGTAISYAKFYFMFSQPPNSTTKWSNVLRTHNVPAGYSYDVTSYVCVGTVQTVANCMVGLAKL